MVLAVTDITDYLSRVFIMQLATIGADNTPWVCSVYFVTGDGLSLYWLSLPTRRHSIEIGHNPKVAVTMAIKTEQPIIGLGAEGTAETFHDVEKIELLMEKYINKYGNGKDFVDRLKAGTNEHVMYKFTPKKYVLVDEVNYPGQGSIDLII
jgi:uncharacterized protein YhbP (UPF0306 family)